MSKTLNFSWDCACFYEGGSPEFSLPQAKEWVDKHLISFSFVIDEFIPNPRAPAQLLAALPESGAEETPMNINYSTNRCNK
eukprot:2926824-Amphidinium_carterae.1